MGAYLSSLPRVSYLVALFPVAVVMYFGHMGAGLPLFVVSALAILGLVTLIGKGTEEIAIYTGPMWGGLLNATFGNVTELIIAIMALRSGLLDIVRSSITGSILGNLLLVLGAAMLYGGLKHPVQRFSRTGANVNLGMLWVAVIALMVPSFVVFAYKADPMLNEALAHDLVRKVSLVAAVILLGIYVLSLIFSLRTHRFVLMPDTDHEETPTWSKRTAVVTLLAATVMVAFASDFFVDALHHMLAVQKLQVSELFVGVVVVAIVGNAAEGSVAIWVARDNKMELSYQIAMGSCLQIALMVAPVLVIASFLINPANPMTLTFNIFELASLVAAVLIAGASLQDGESNWLEGALFLAVYFFFAMVFWFHP